MLRGLTASDPVRLLIIVVLIDVVAGAVLRTAHAVELVSGDGGWHSWLGLIAGLYLFVVVYALRVVAQHSSFLDTVLRQRTQTLEAHAETTTDWLWETTPELLLTYSSRRVNDVLGYAPEDVVGRDAYEFMAPGAARRSRAAIASGAARAGWRDLDIEWLHADGHVVALRHSGVAITDAKGELVGYRGTCSAPPAEHEQVRRLDIMRERVVDALEAEGIAMALQPIIDVISGQVVGVEALARFPDGRSPDLWFEEAGAVDLRNDLEMLAVRRALQRLRELPEHITMSVNACPEALLDPRFAPMLLDQDVPLSRLVIEITEHTRVDDYARLETTLMRLREAGAGLAVDDTGAGYSSLAHVLRLRPDIVKLDRSLVTSLETDRARRTLVTSLTLLALDIGAQVTAEGVETAQELEAVATLGVDRAQGYLIGRPTIALSDWPSGLLTCGYRASD